MLQNKTRFYGAKWYAGSQCRIDSVKCGEYRKKKKKKEKTAQQTEECTN